MKKLKNKLDLNRTWKNTEEDRIEVYGDTKGLVSSKENLEKIQNRIELKYMEILKD